MAITKSNTKRATLNTDSCSITFCMKYIGGKWKPILLDRISKGQNRFGLLIACVEGINRQMLSKQLKELERDGLLERKVYGEIPPRVEYNLTVKGQSLLPLVQAMNRWGQKEQHGTVIEEEKLVEITKVVKPTKAVKTTKPVKKAPPSDSAQITLF
ncbi:helix-turn-helix transcriptional regulator [Aurantibacter crassamenti]|uniref:winged helix-turn-helix transcriptional regulator n=1 Tax=Aurantibacter crassamenti TaxID=1837375 RepID=UPI001939C586|nr:helix-turn-helix domain-containing protein [Aurantibacter crassamenti]MBM1107615.1 helix-turn-helix transcriptional regulator [Aurantibacter crassamenti]